MTVVFCLTVFAICAVVAAVHLELQSRSSPQWLGVVAGTAIGGILTLANPLKERHGRIN